MRNSFLGEYEKSFFYERNLEIMCKCVNFYVEFTHSMTHN